jgi:hypothetical protein
MKGWIPEPTVWWEETSMETRTFYKITTNAVPDILGGPGDAHTHTHTHTHTHRNSHSYLGKKDSEES